MTKDEALKMAIKELSQIALGDTPALKACKEALEPEIKLADTISVEDYQMIRDWKHTIDERIARDSEFKEALEQPNRFEGYTTIEIGHKKIAQEPISCHCGNSAFNLQSITHTKTKCFQHSLQNPVAWMYEWEDEKSVKLTFHPDSVAKTIPLYTHPHQWQGLTDEEKLSSIRKWAENNTKRGQVLIILCDFIELALKDKNT